MHFCVSAARVSRPGIAPAHLLTSALFWPRKMGTNWFMPALVNSRFGESGMRLEDGTMVCCFDLKKSRNDWRISDDVIMAKSIPGRDGALRRPVVAARGPCHKQTGRVVETGGARRVEVSPGQRTQEKA